MNMAFRMPKPVRKVIADARVTLPRFLVVGAFGFCVDASVLIALTAVLGLPPLPARLVSILVAVSATWLLHRGFTFRSRDPGRLGEWTRFASVNALGAVLNFTLYAGALAILPGLPPFLALVAASAVALGVNYLGSALFAFRAAHRTP